jgi:hypothetical protein
MTLGWDELTAAVKSRDARTIVHRLPEIEKCLRSSPYLTRERVEREILHGRKMVLKACPFPYDVEGHHYILWMRDLITHAQAWKVLVTRLPSPFLLYENPRGFRSVPHTQHFHVFTKTPIS